MNERNQQDKELEKYFLLRKWQKPYYKVFPPTPEEKIDFRLIASTKKAINIIDLIIAQINSALGR